VPLIESESFHEERRSAITSTDMPKILGLSPWGSPRTVWLDKVDPQPPKPMSIAMRLGLELEPTIARLFTEETGVRVRRVRGFYRAPGRPHVAAHADYRVVGKHALLECKTRRDDTGWGPSGGSVVPVDVWIQCQIEMLCTRTRLCHVGVLFGFGEYRTMQVWRDDDFISGALETADRFWHDNVLAGVMPDMIFADLDALAEEFPADTDETLRTATPEADLLIERYAIAREQRMEAQRAEDTIKARLQRFIGNNAGVQGQNGLVTWKRDNPQPQLDTDVFVESLIENALRNGVDPEVILRFKTSAMLTREPRRVFHWGKA